MTIIEEVHNLYKLLGLKYDTEEEAKIALLITIIIKHMEELIHEEIR